MSEIPTISRDLSNDEITELLKSAYSASDRLDAILTADIPVLSPAYGGRYEQMMQHAQQQISETIQELSTSPDLLELADTIHTKRCGCTADNQTEGCDWFVVGKSSSAKSVRILQAAELKLNGISFEDINLFPEHFSKFIDYLEAPADERPKLQAELEQMFTQS